MRSRVQDQGMSYPVHMRISNGLLVGLFFGYIQCNFRQSKERNHGRGRDFWPVESPNGIHKRSSTSGFVLIPRLARIDNITLCRPVKSVPCLIQKRQGSCQNSSIRNQSKNQTNHGGQSPCLQVILRNLAHKCGGEQTMGQAHGGN